MISGSANDKWCKPKWWIGNWVIKKILKNNSRPEDIFFPLSNLKVEKIISVHDVWQDHIYSVSTLHWS